MELKDRIAVVTGASRGAGRAIAAALGEAGATVYVTGRSVRGGPTTEGLPGTIDETADEISTRGGTGMAVRVDHTVDAEVEALFERVRSEQGRLDLLVSNAWGGYEGYDDAPFDAPFWEQPLERWDRMFTAGARTHFTAARFAAPLMVERGTGLIVSTIAWAYGAPMGNAVYDAAKTAVARLAASGAVDLREHGVAWVALAPGWMRTERVVAAFEGAELPYDRTESPGYVARAILALAADPGVIARSGEVLTAGDLAREYGFTDVDGRQPEPFRIPAPQQG